MKKSTTRITIVISLLIVAVVSYYAYLSNRSRADRAEASVTFVQNTLSRKLDTNYPSTPKEVLKYYNDLQKCFYNEDYTEEEFEKLVLKVRELYDEELLEKNSLADQTIQLLLEIQEYKEKKRTITSISLPSSANVVYDTVDGYEFAKIHCGYNVMEAGVNKPMTQVFLLRKDAGRKWKIYGWKILDTFQETEIGE